MSMAVFDRVGIHHHTAHWIFDAIFWGSLPGAAGGVAVYVRFVICHGNQTHSQIP